MPTALLQSAPNYDTENNGTMKSNIETMKNDLEQLVARASTLYYSLADELGRMDADTKKAYLDKGLKIVNFSTEYDNWYTVAMRVVKQLIPDRYDDFVLCFNNQKRKDINYLSYGISDYLIGLRTTRGSSTVVDGGASLVKMERQVAILTSAQQRFESTVYDLREVLQADLFDSELDAASELAKKGFLRAAGAVSGVVLEKHLKHVCEEHKIASKKAHPTISEFNDLLKNVDVIDVIKWRFIQHLGDIRNLCDHGKDREPEKDEVLELVHGVAKIIKTVF